VGRGCTDCENVQAKSSTWSHSSNTGDWDSDTTAHEAETSLCPE